MDRQFIYIITVMERFNKNVEEAILFKYDYEEERFYQVDKAEFPVYTICDVG